MSVATHPTDDARRAWTHVLAVSVGLTALLALLVVAFAWPATQLAPRSLPIVVAGPAEATAQVTAALGQAVPGGFEVTTVADEPAARAAIENRDAYGAIVVGPTPTVLTASAASPVVAQLMNQLATLRLLLAHAFHFAATKNDAADHQGNAHRACF